MQWALTIKKKKKERPKLKYQIVFNHRNIMAFCYVVFWYQPNTPCFLILQSTVIVFANYMIGDYVICNFFFALTEIAYQYVIKINKQESKKVIIEGRRRRSKGERLRARQHKETPTKLWQTSLG